MAKFNLGDLVVGNSSEYHITCKGWRGTVKTVLEDGMIEVAPLAGQRGRGSYTVQESCFDFVSAAPEVKFILQYELDEDPFEMFSTMNDVEKRIKELAKRNDLKRDSIFVYEVSKTLKVTLDTRVFFGTKVTTTEKKAGVGKRGRGKKSHEQKLAEKREYMRLYNLRRKAEREAAGIK